MKYVLEAGILSRKHSKGQSAVGVKDPLELGIMRDSLGMEEIQGWVTGAEARELGRSSADSHWGLQNYFKHE